MKLSHSILTALAIGLVLSTGSALLAADDAAANLAKAPAAVQAAAKKALGDNKLQEFTKEQVGDKVVYEAACKIGDADHTYVISEKGELVQEEADLEVAKLPDAVAAAVKKAHPDGTVTEAATATAGDKHFYEVDLKVGDVTRAMKVNADGSVIADDVTKELEL
jgi:uncharacterized membrane protein YkoI